MTRYAIGDVQGCFDSLEALLEKIEFDSEDEIWLAGDLVNRGPRSLDVLRWARGLGDCATVVLGNHDLHLLKVVAGSRPIKKRDTMQSIVEAEDCDELIDWLRKRPLLHVQDEFALVHAGLLPGWSIEFARECAAAVEAQLAGDDWLEFVREFAQIKPPGWHDDLTGIERLASTLSVLTSVRACRADGEICTGFAGPPDEIPAGFKPWFAFPKRASRDTTVLFGHWAALGLHIEDGAICLDSGCVWGDALTALRLPDRVVFQQTAID